MGLPVSDEEILILHNPRCSKSRATLALLEEREAAFSVRAYLDEPLDAAELAALQERLGRPLKDWVRTKDEAFVASGLPTDADDEALIALVVAHPAVMERPIVVRGSRAVVGRPPENVLELL